MATLPAGLQAHIRPVTIIVGHYGVGKTNFAVNLAIDLVQAGNEVTLVDLDIVNPYFRASEQRAVLQEHGVALVAPVFAEAGSSLDVPSLTGMIAPVIEQACPGRLVIVDVGGDDAGSTALGRYARQIRAADFEVLGVLNAFRNLVSDPADAVDNLREIEAACGLTVDALVNNSHLKHETDAAAIDEGFEYAQKVAGMTGLPLACTAVNGSIADSRVSDEQIYRIKMYVKTPWDM